MDVLPARDITSASNGTDVFELQPGVECKAAFKGQHFQAEVLAVGKFYFFMEQKWWLYF